MTPMAADACLQSDESGGVSRDAGKIPFPEAMRQEPPHAGSPGCLWDNAGSISNLRQSVPFLFFFNSDRNGFRQEIHQASSSRLRAQPPGRRPADRQKAALADLQAQFSLSQETQESLVLSFVRELKLGLAKDNQAMHMIPTYFILTLVDSIVNANFHYIVVMMRERTFHSRSQPSFHLHFLCSGIPTGEERGTYLALEVAGTEVRVAQLKLKGGRGQFSIHEIQYSIPDELNSGDDFGVLIDYITDCIDDFLTRVGSQDLFVYSMGVSFGCALRQGSLRQAKIIELPLEYSYPDAAGKDVVKLLHDSIEKKGLAVRVTAMANDSVCALLAQAYQAPTTTMGVLHGMGTNCAYVERLSNISKFKHDYDLSPDETMIVNTEWGSFDNERCRLPLTWFDRRCDRESVNPHYQIFEKMTSAKYLGEITRLVLLYLVDCGLLFGASSSQILNTCYTFDTTFMFACEADDSEDLRQVGIVLEKLMKIRNVTLADRQIVKKVCQIVGSRSAVLVATAMAGVIRQMAVDGIGIGEQGITIATSGDLHELYPSFQARLCDALKTLVGEELAPRITVVIVRSSRLVGSAIVAMMAENDMT
ncbi:hypothetical protein BC936DRAFT_148019 [Jimgerdemannia flammicorona]|uniref:Phosphotransferase n=1 Tax=Jimgerdemannia flammicorona TaxID=994334 RepID=A0A433DKS5_9FUNG|nr:hypothetical protein BC936DRAFT_148019 [Jimgerdemannia flammicorona]